MLTKNFPAKKLKRQLEALKRAHKRTQDPSLTEAQVLAAERECVDLINNSTLSHSNQQQQIQMARSKRTKRTR